MIFAKPDGPNDDDTTQHAVTRVYKGTVHASLFDSGEFEPASQGPEERIDDEDNCVGWKAKVMTADEGVSPYNTRLPLSIAAYQAAAWLFYLSSEFLGPTFLLSAHF